MNPEWVLTFSCADGPGIVHAISGAVERAFGNITESQQVMSHDTGNFFMRLQVESVTDHDGFEKRFRNEIEPIANHYAMEWVLDTVGRPMRTLVLASKATHCVNDLLYRKRSGSLSIEVPLVLANHGVLRHPVRIPPGHRCRVEGRV